MDLLYSPWRSEYVSGDVKKEECVFCNIVNNDNDEKFGVLHKDKDTFIVMNMYPYNPAHFMIIPNKHISNLEDLDQDIWLRMAKYAQQGVVLLKDIVNAQGVNIGMNIGKAGGAGIASHIHLHLVPRWMGDTNFMTTITNSRVYSTDFDKIYKKLKQEATKYFK